MHNIQRTPLPPPTTLAGSDHDSADDGDGDGVSFIPAAPLLPLSPPAARNGNDAESEHALDVDEDEAAIANAEANASFALSSRGALHSAASGSERSLSRLQLLVLCLCIFFVTWGCMELFTQPGGRAPASSRSSRRGGGNGQHPRAASAAEAAAEAAAAADPISAMQESNEPVQKCIPQPPPAPQKKKACPPPPPPPPPLEPVAVTDTSDSTSIVVEALNTAKRPGESWIHENLPQYQSDHARYFASFDMGRSTPLERWSDWKGYKAARTEAGLWTAMDAVADTVLSSPVVPRGVAPAAKQTRSTSSTSLFMAFDPVRFRSTNTPVLWAEASADVKGQSATTRLAQVQWNVAAENALVALLQQQQFSGYAYADAIPASERNEAACARKQFLVLPQSPAGVFNRFETFVWSTLVATQIPNRVILLSDMPLSRGGWEETQQFREDYSGAGLASFLQPVGACSDQQAVREYMEYVPTPSLQTPDAANSKVPPRAATAASMPTASNVRDVQQSGQHAAEKFVKLSIPGVTAPKPETVVFDDACPYPCYSVHPNDASSLGALAPDHYWRRLLFDPRVDPNNNQHLSALLTPAEEATGAPTAAADHSVEHIYVGGAGSLRAASSLELRSALWAEFFVSVASAFFFRLRAPLLVQRALISDFWATQVLRRRNVYPLPEMLLDSFWAAGAEKVRTGMEEKFGPTNGKEDPSVQVHYVDSYAIGPDDAAREHPLANMAAIIQRRADRCEDDDYCSKHGRWRPLALYFASILEEEQRRGRPFASIHVLTDDGVLFDKLLYELSGESEPIMDVNVVYTIPNKMNTEQIDDVLFANMYDMDKLEWELARSIMQGRVITHNPLSPQSCFRATTRASLEGYLVSLAFMLRHDAFVVTYPHSAVSGVDGSGSAVVRLMDRVLWLQNHQQPGVRRTGAGSMTKQVMSDFPQPQQRLRQEL